MSSPKEAQVGASPARPDGAAKVRGEALYVDDLAFEGMWFGATVRSPHPAARILGIHASALAAGVVLVTAADLPGPNVLRVIADDWPCLAHERVRHVGEPVALVAAPTRAAARAAAAALRVAYAEEPAILDLDEALRQGSRELAQCRVERGDVDGALASAAHVIEGTYETGHQEHAYIEPQGMIALPHADGSLELVGSMQCPYYVHGALTHLFGLSPRAVRVRQAATGGGFGGKEDFPDMIAAHAALLARKAGRPVKLVYERHEDIVATTKRHPSRVRHRTGVGAGGVLLAMEIDVLLDGGAYTTLSPVVLSRAVLHAGGAYACPNVRIQGRVLATNTATNGAFRGFGAPQTQFAVERHVDRIARALGLDPWTIRERNAYRAGDVTPTGQVLSESVSALECLHEAERRTDFRRRWREREAERAAGARTGVLRGVGLSLSWHGAGFTGNGERRMRSPVAMRLGQGGVAQVLVSSTDFGQGTTIALAQIAADALGVGVESIDVVEPDTAVVPDSGPTVASRTVMVVGSALEHAARSLARGLCAYVAELRSLSPDAVRLRRGDFVGPRGAALASFAEMAERHLAERGALEVVERYEPDERDSFDEETYTGAAYAAYGFGATVVEVEVDADTLVTRPTKATLVCDVGKAIHPVLCAGQVEGGALQALGLGYLEEIKMKGGRYLNDTLSTYILPTALDAPDMETVLLEHPSPVGPQGAKGVGELPTDGGAPALVAAIENAVGIASARAPATPESLLTDLIEGRVVAGAPRIDRAEVS